MADPQNNLMPPLPLPAPQDNQNAPPVQYPVNQPAINPINQPVNNVPIEQAQVI
jgi:hypothetical protein